MSDKAQEKEYMIFLGNFGSGKTELAMHFAMDAAAAVSYTHLDVYKRQVKYYER